MSREIPFRKLLPIVQCVAAVVFGGFGLWRRSVILSGPWLDGQTLWDTTARFHVWPWPFKFAVITNMPAFLAGSLLSWPIGDHWPKLPEFVGCIPSLLFVLILWYGVGLWLDRRLAMMSKPATQVKRAWMQLLVFTLICAMGACPHSTSTYVLYGMAVWIILGFWMWRRRPRMGSEVEQSLRR